MSDTALRQLLAEFVVEVDKAGELKKGNAAVDALKKRLEELQAAAKPAARAVGDAFAGIGAKAQKNLLALGAQALGGSGGGGDAFAAAGASAKKRLEGALSWAGGRGGGGGDGFAGLHGLVSGIGPQFAPTRQTLQAGRAAMAEAEAEAARYAGTLRGKLGSALQAVRDGFNGRPWGGWGRRQEPHRSPLRLQDAAPLLGAGATVAGVRHLVDSIGDISEGAQRLGVTTDEFQRLNVLAAQNNTSVEALGTAFRNLSNAAVEPTKQTTAAFTALGVSVKDGAGQFKSANDLFFDTTAALAGVGDETQRNALAQDLLGRSALELKPLFANGTAAVNEQRKELMGLHVISKETITQADRVSDTWKGLGLRFLAATEPLLKVLSAGAGEAHGLGDEGHRLVRQVLEADGPRERRFDGARRGRRAQGAPHGSSS
jgi:hypothetical protein